MGDGRAVEGNPRGFSAETRASVEMMRAIGREYMVRVADLDEEVRQLTERLDHMSPEYPPKHDPLTCPCCVAANEALMAKTDR